MADKKKTPGKRGRKDLWDELNMESRLKTIEGWAKNGMTNEEMYNALNVSKDVFYRWRKEKPEFKAALMKGKFESNGEILNSAFKQATGYYQTVTEPFKVKTFEEFVDPETGRTSLEEVEVIIDHTYNKFFPPTTAMAIFMLKNRIPADYKDKQDLNHTGSVVTANVDLSYMTDEEIKEALKKYGDD